MINGLGNFARIRAETISCLFRRRFLLLLLFLDAGGAAADNLRRLDRRHIVGRRLLLDVGYDAAFVVSQLIDDSRHERPFVHVLLYTTMSSPHHHHHRRHHHQQHRLLLLMRGVARSNSGMDNWRNRMGRWVWEKVSYPLLGVE